MSDTEKDNPETPQSGESETRPSRGAQVISIEQARAELLGKPRMGGSPQRGAGRGRPRHREVPAPVTMPPGEHAAVIVADTPAARVHVDKKTVHPGEMPNQTHEKKVRFKTQIDPRRAKTQMSERRAEAEAMAMQAPTEESHPGSLWNRPSQPPGPAASPSTMPPPRLSLARPKAAPDTKSSAPLFVVGVVLAAAFGAAIVYFLSRAGAPVTTAATATAPIASLAPPATSSAAAVQTVAAPAQSAVTAAPSETVAPSTPATSAQGASGVPAVKSAVPAVKASAASSAAPTATAKATATSILPFGKEEP